MQATSSLLIEAVDPQHPQALALLREAAQEARKQYPDLFSPDTPDPTNPPPRSREVYLLAWRDGKALGCGALRQRDAFTGEVLRMFVTRAARRDGIARTLLARLEHDARQHGYRQLVLETGSRQLPAVALYKNCGWRRIAPYPPYVGDPMSVCMGKSLASPA